MLANDYKINKKVDKRLQFFKLQIMKNSMKKNILITGGAGYVGSILVKKLLEKGYKVKVIDLFWFSNESIFDGYPNKQNLEVHKADLRDYGTIEKIINNVDVVISLAAVANDPCADLQPEVTKQINLDSINNLVDISKKHKVKRFINASSSSVYGVKDDPEVTEDLELNPLTLYAKYKAESEKYIQQCNSEDFTTVSIRSATVFGYSPRIRLDLTVNMLTAFALNKNKIIVFGGEQMRPNIHIEDITDLYVMLIETDKELISGDVFNAGYENHKVMEIAKIIKGTLSEKEIEIEIKPVVDERSYRISSKKINDRLNFFPKYTLQQGIREISDLFTNGVILNWEDPEYYNIKTMKLLELK